MESYEQAVDLALMVVNLDKSVFKTMIRSGLTQYLNSQYPMIAQTNNKHEMDKFVLASKILLNDLQAIPVSQCSSRTCNYGCMMNNCDKNVNYKTPVFQQALIDPENVVNSNVTRYLDDYNSNTFNPQISRMQQPLDTIGLYQDNTHQSMNNFNNYTGFGPEAKVRLEEHFNNPTTHPVPDARNAFYSQYSKLYVTNDGEGYLDESMMQQTNDEQPIRQRRHYNIHNGRLMQ